MNIFIYKLLPLFFFLKKYVIYGFKHSDMIMNMDTLRIPSGSACLDQESASEGLFGIW